MRIVTRKKEKKKINWKISLVIFFLIIGLSTLSFFLLRTQIIQHAYDNIIIRTYIKSTGIGGINRQISPLSVVYDLYQNILKYHKSTQELETIIIDIKFIDFLQLEKNRKNALEDGMINKTHSVYVNAKIKMGNKKVKAKLRLKGWYLDHLATNKWSLKVKVLDGHIKGKKTFTLNAPHTKDFHSSKLINEAMRYREILAPEDDFFKVIINGKKIGVMYFEESFSEQLTESSSRPYGPILYSDEKSNFNDKFIDRRQYWGKDKNLKLIFSNIRDVLKNPNNKSDFLNYDLWAEYIAITFLFKCYHGNLHLNLSHYFHPVEKKLEPISSDNACGQKDPSRILGYFPREKEFVHSLLKIGTFNELLKKKVQWWLENKNANKFLTELRKRESYLRRVLAKESPFLQKFSIQTDHLPDVITWLNKEIQKPNTLTDEDLSTDKNKILALPQIEITKSFDQLIFKINKFLSKRYKLTELIVKYPTKEVKIDLSYEFSSSDISKELNKIITRNSQFTVSKIYFLYNDLYRNKIINNAVNLRYTEQIDHPFAMFQKSIIESLFHFDTVKNTYFLKNNQRIIINDTVILPEGSGLLLNKGSQIEFKNRAGLVVRGGFTVKGTLRDQVYLKGSVDNRWSGVLILGNGSDVSINYLNVVGGNGIINGYHNRGAFTINKANVSIQNSSFSQNMSEDALNLVQAQGTLNKVVIKNTKSDALDIDYGKIEILNSQFFNIGSSTGADAIDVSKSIVIIKHTNIENVTDKGISIGENSEAFISETTIKSALVGIVSKDSSTVKALNINLDEIKFADTMSYTKKLHFDGAEIEAVGLSTNLNNHINQNKSVSSINGLNIKAQKIDVDLLYDTFMAPLK